MFERNLSIVCVRTTISSMVFNFNIFDNDLILTLILTNSDIAKIKERGTMLRQTAECGEDRDKKISSIDQQVESKYKKLDGGWS